jgi:ketosteroid isomerase-like protein
MAEFDGSNHRREEEPTRGENAMGRNITAVVEKKMRVAKARAEIDRILTGPDPPFDLEAAMENVVSITCGPDGEVGDATESSAAELERDLYSAVKRQDYGAAAAKKRELGALQLDAASAVLQTNAAFYRAFSTKDYQAMQSVWLQDEAATCIHPSAKPLVGSRAVLSSWRRMFASADGGFQRTWMEPSGVRVTVKGGGTAVVTCDERVYARRFVRGRRRQTELINQLTATNVFRKVGGRWYLTHHHASWHPESEAAKHALSRSLQSSSSSSSHGSIVRDGDNNDNNHKESSAMMDGILGMSNFGPLLGGGGSGGGGDSGQEQRKPKIVMGGSLSDLLGGKLGELLGNSGVSSSEAGGSAIIRFHRIEGEQDDDDDDDDDDEEEDLEFISDELDDDDDDDDEDDEDDSMIILETQRTNESTKSSTSSKAISSSKESKTSNSAAPKDSLRQNCISALRKLCQQGNISPKQKRILLTDIITSSAKGEFSLVEVAYELLWGESDDVVEEEFADQCRVFATQLEDASLLPQRGE